MSKSPLIRCDSGLYRVRGPVSASELVSLAATVLGEKVLPEERLNDPRQASRFLQLMLANEENEHFAALFLTGKHQVLHFERLFSGTIDSVAVYPRVVVQKALACNAAAVIFAHNHPSNHCDPSDSDRRITRQLTKALALVDVRVLDHFVVSRTDIVSMAERGWL